MQDFFKIFGNMETKQKQFFVPFEACALSGSRVGVMEGPVLLANNEKKLILCLLTYRWQLQAWASEGFFSRGASRGFSQIYFQGGVKSGEIWFSPFEIEKTTFFC